MRETCVTLFSEHVETMHEQRKLGSAEVASQHASRPQTMYRHIIERVDGRPSGDVAEAGQEGIPSVCQSEDSSLDESIGLVEDASGEREQSCRDDDSRPELCSSVQGEQSWDSAVDTLGEESLVTIQLEQ